MPVERTKDTVELKLASGASSTIYLFGAHVTSWKTSGGKERFYLSKTGKLDGSTPIRGGIPVCWVSGSLASSLLEVVARTSGQLECTADARR